MLKTSCTGCFGLSSSILSQFTLEMCAAAKNCEKKFTNTFFGVQLGRSSLKVIDVYKSKKPITNACYDMQHVCAYLQPFLRYTR